MPVKRRYDATSRRAKAAESRERILAAARHLFARRGYRETTVAELARKAGVAVDTVYASVGGKPALFRLLLETALSGSDEEVPLLDRDYMKAIAAEPDAGRRLDLYAGAVTAIQARLAPLLGIVRGAGPGEPEVLEAWSALVERRARGLRLLPRMLVELGALRPGLDEEEAADVAWAVSSTEVFVLLTAARGWRLERYQAFLSDTFRRLLLAPASAAAPTDSLAPPRAPARRRRGGRG